jgi:hypothetical protein
MLVEVELLALVHLGGQGQHDPSLFAFPDAAVKIPQGIPHPKPSETEDKSKSNTPPSWGKKPLPPKPTILGDESLPGERPAKPILVVIDGGAEIKRAKLLAVIEATGPEGVTKNELVRKTQGLKAGLRNALLDELVKEGLVVASKQTTRTRPAMLYRAMVHERRRLTAR